MMISEPNSFSLWSLTHFTAVVTIIVAALLALGAARLSRRPQTQRAGRLALALAIALSVTAGIVRRVLLGDGSWAEILPIHLCYVSLIMTGVALATLRRLPFEFAYFFGIGGTVQALLTPDVTRDFPSYEYVAFFAAHAGIVVGVVYLMAACRMKPEPGAVLRMVAAGNVYMLAAGLVNYFGNENYGYLCRKPSHGSLLDHMGPWPWYLGAMELMALGTLLLLNLPFVLERRRRKERG